MKCYNCPRNPRIRYGLGASGILAFVWALLVLSPTMLRAQSAEITHKVTNAKKDRSGPDLGRDIWFGVPQNFLNQPGKYFKLYVTSPVTTTVHIETATKSIAVLVPALTVYTYDIPLSMEMTTSGLPEKKSIHVYSRDADLCCYMMSHNPGSSDGMYLIPSIGWGNDYVVAAYEALYEGSGYIYDQPSEFVIFANQDKTYFDITPTADMKPSNQPYPAGKTFRVRLERGEVMQFETLQAQDADHYDLTGTIIHTDKPAGLIGASQCATIPSGYESCDHVCDMIPPIRTWSKTYYSAPFYKSQTLNATKGGNTILVIGSKAGQMIYQSTPTVPKKLFCILTGQYSLSWDNDVREASKWESDTAFLLVMYMNSSTYPDGLQGIGDPAECVVNPVEQYSNTVVFETPGNTGNQVAYQNYVNVIVNEHAKSTTYDGIDIRKHPRVQLPKTQIDTNFSAYIIRLEDPGTHIVKSDSGVGVFVYGYGDRESYAWTGTFGTRSVNQHDTTSPAVRITDACFHARVSVADTEKLATKLGEIRLDAATNMTFRLDTNWQEGVGMDSSYYDLKVIDSTLPAMLVITVLDLSGNSTTISSSYTPRIPSLSTAILNFGTGTQGGPEVVKYLSLSNKTPLTFSLAGLSLVRGGQGFTIDSGIVNPIAPTANRTVRIGYQPTQPSSASDTLLITDGCTTLTVVLLGTGGTPDFAVSDDNWGTQPDRSIISNNLVTVTNLSSQPMSIDSIITDNPAFTYRAGDPRNPALPFTIPGDSSTQLYFDFATNGAGAHFGHATFKSVSLRISHTDSLYGFVVSPSENYSNDIYDTLLCPTSADTLPLVFNIDAFGDAPTPIKTILHADSAGTSQSQYFTGLSVTEDLQPENLDTGIVYLTRGHRFTINGSFHPVAGVSGTFVDSILVYDKSGLLLNTYRSYITVYNRALSLNTAMLNFPPVAYGTGPGAAQSFLVTNTGLDAITIARASIVNGPYSKAFSVTYALGGAAANPPVPLQPGQSLTVNVKFNASVSYDSVQTCKVNVESNSCISPVTLDVRAVTFVSDAITQSYTSAPIFACATESGNVIVRNPNPAPGFKDTILSATISGIDKNNFSIPAVPRTVLAGNGGSATIPVTFTPTASPGSKTYQASLDIVMRNAVRSFTVSTPLSGTAVGASVTGSATFAANSAQAGSIVQLPIAIAVDKGLNPTGSLVSLGVNEIRFTYNLNTDLLGFRGADPNNAPATASAIAKAVTTSAGWSVDQANTSLVGTTLVLALQNPNGLDDATANTGTLGDIRFFVTVPKIDTIKDVSLRSVGIFRMDATGAYVPLVGCVSGAVGASSSFGLIYQCSDSVLQKVMNSDYSGLSIRPISPNPVTSSKAKISYATRVMTPITISIFDVLGNEIVRPIENIEHSAGVYEINLDVSHLSSGTYTCRIAGNRYSASKQFVVSH